MLRRSKGVSVAGYRDGIFQTKGKGGLGINHGGASACDEYTDSRNHRASDRAHPGAKTTINACSDCRTQGRSCADGCHVAAYGRPTIALGHLRFNGNLLAIRNAKFGELYAHARRTFHAAGFQDFHYAPAHHLATPGNHPAIDNDRLRQTSGESIAGLVVISGQRLVYSNRDPSASRNGERHWPLRRRLLSLRFMPTSRVSRWRHGDVGLA